VEFIAKQRQFGFDPRPHSAGVLVQRNAPLFLNGGGVHPLFAFAFGVVDLFIKAGLSLFAVVTAVKLFSFRHQRLLVGASLLPNGLNERRKNRGEYQREEKENLPRDRHRDAPWSTRKRKIESCAF